MSPQALVIPPFSSISSPRSSRSSSSSFPSSSPDPRYQNHASILRTFVGLRLLFSFRGHSPSDLNESQDQLLDTSFIGDKCTSLMLWTSITSLWTFTAKYQYSWRRNERNGKKDRSWKQNLGVWSRSILVTSKSLCRSRRLATLYFHSIFLFYVITFVSENKRKYQGER